jgi:hypothetical protein
MTSPALDELVVQENPPVVLDHEELGAYRVDLVVGRRDHLPVEADRAVVADGLLSRAESKAT